MENFGYKSAVDNGGGQLGYPFVPVESLGLGVFDGTSDTISPDRLLSYQSRIDGYPDLSYVFIRTLEEYGWINLGLEFLDSPPVEITNNVENVEEFSITCHPASDPVICFFDSGEEPESHDPVLIPAGTPETEFRIRVSAAGLEDFIALDVPTIDWEPDEPYERFTIQAWPAPLAEPKLIKRTAKVSRWLADRYGMENVGEVLDLS